MDGLSSVNQVIGTVWAAETIHLGVYNFDPQKEMKEFHSLFYHRELTDPELNETPAEVGHRNWSVQVMR